MKRIALLAVCGTLGLLPQASDPSCADAPDKKKDHVTDLLGDWTVVHSELEGDATASIPNPGGRSSGLAGPGGTPAPILPFIWKIAKDQIQAGWERVDLNFPVCRWQCQWNPGGTAGTVDLIGLDRFSGKKVQPEELWKGIFVLKDDVMMICYSFDNAPRPEHFSTAAKSKSVLVILRRGKTVYTVPPTK